MLVLCCTNRISSLPTASYVSQNKHKYYGKGTELLSLTVQQTYVVYAMLQNFSGTWFFVADDDFSFTEYPLAYPSLFFNMIDGRVSKYWTNPAITEVDGHRTEFRAFKEWMSDPMFYERLVDWHKTENAIFREYKELMDIEFPNPIKYKPVSYIEDDWCQCVACEHVWENFQTDSGMLRCPKCRQVLIDPRWAEPIQQEILFI